MLQEFNRHLETAKSYARKGGNEIYIAQYPSVLKTIKSIPRLDFDSLQVINMAVYAWMPTTLKKSCPKSGEIVLSILNEFKENGSPIKDEDAIHFMKFTNNSYVGASKFLHFVDPDNFAIWDSKVAKVLNVKHHNTLNAFNDYQHALRSFSDNNLIGEAMTLSREIHGGFPVTKMRAIEHCLWMCAKN